MATGAREQPIDESKYEKSLDNRCAALVSRERRAPRVGQDRKSRMVNGLRLMSLLSRARGAHVSRAARGHFVLFSGRACPPLDAPSIESPRLRMSRRIGALRENGAQRLASKPAQRARVQRLIGVMASGTRGVEGATPSRRGCITAKHAENGAFWCKWCMDPCNTSPLRPFMPMFPIMALALNMGT